MTARLPLQVAVGVIKNAQNQVLVALRPDHVHQGGLWEFPGGKIAADETVMQALNRELQEELGIIMSAASPLITLQYAYPDLTVQLNVMRVDAYTGQAYGREGQAIRWVTLEELATLSFPAANAPIVTAVQLPDYYAILDTDSVVAATPLQALENLLTQNIKLIQIRLKHLVARELEQFLTQAIPLCETESACLLLNSSLPGAWHHNAVHLTSHDLMQLSQRPVQTKWLAASCHTLAELQHAQTLGVDFIVLAPVLTTLTHPQSIPLGWVRFAELVSACNVPIYALGGLKKQDLSEAKQRGAQGIAGIRLFYK